MWSYRLIWRLSSLLVGNAWALILKWYQSSIYVRRSIHYSKKKTVRYRRFSFFFFLVFISSHWSPPDDMLSWFWFRRSFPETFVPSTADGLSSGLEKRRVYGAVVVKRDGLKDYWSRQIWAFQFSDLRRSSIADGAWPSGCPPPSSICSHVWRWGKRRGWLFKQCRVVFSLRFSETRCLKLPPPELSPGGWNLAVRHDVTLLPSSGKSLRLRPVVRSHATCNFFAVPVPCVVV